MMQVKVAKTVVDQSECYAEVGGKKINMTGSGPSPTDLLIASLGGCLALTLQSILQKRRVNVEKVEVDTKAYYSNDPAYFGEVDVHFRVKTKTPVDNTVLQSSVQLAEKYCPVHLTYSNQVEINTSCSAEQS